LERVSKVDKLEVVDKISQKLEGIKKKKLKLSKLSFHLL
jgi:hypothetical protein